jgi:hypothetical protein
MAIIIPELIIKETLETLLKFLKADTADKSTDSYLYNLLGVDDEGKPLALNRFNYLEQARAIFSDSMFDNGNPKIYLGYNMEVTKFPAIHIILPSEQSDPLTLGADEGYQAGKVVNKGKDYSVSYTMNADATFQLIITSENSSEVVLIYHVIRACLLAINDQLSLRGFMNPRVGGGDLNIQQDFVPPNIFHRALALSFKYEINTFAIAERTIAKKIIINQLLDDGDGNVAVTNTNTLPK